MTAVFFKYEELLILIKCMNNYPLLHFLICDNRQRAVCVLVGMGARWLVCTLSEPRSGSIIYIINKDLCLCVYVCVCVCV